MPAVRRSARARRRPWLLLVFPSTSTRIMAGSIGELTALVRLARSLPRRRFKVSFVEFVRSPRDPHPRVDGLLRSLDGFALLEMEERDQGGGLAVRQRPLPAVPDAVVLSSFRAFFQYPQFPRLIHRALERWVQAGIRVMALDPCGDSCVCPIPKGVSVIASRPFTYGSLPREVLTFSTGARVPRRRPPQRWLWAAAPWMRCYRRRIMSWWRRRKRRRPRN